MPPAWLSLAARAVSKGPSWTELNPRTEDNNVCDDDADDATTMS